MDSNAQKVVNETIIALCEHIQDRLNSNVADLRKDLPELVTALAKLTN